MAWTDGPKVKFSDPLWNILGQKLDVVFHVVEKLLYVFSMTHMNVYPPLTSFHGIFFELGRK